MINTVPEILRALNEMSSICSYDDIKFVGLEVTNFGSVSISDKEFNYLLQEVLQENKIKSVVVKTNGLIIRKEVGLGGIFMHN